MPNCIICNTPLKFSNKPILHGGRLNDGTEVCLQCFRVIIKKNPVLNTKTINKDKAIELFKEPGKKEIKKFQSIIPTLDFPDNINTIDFHLLAIERHFKSNNLELVNLSYAKLIEGVRQYSKGNKGILDEQLQIIRDEYEKFRNQFGYEYPPQFLPPPKREKL